MGHLLNETLGIGTTKAISGTRRQRVLVAEGTESRRGLLVSALAEWGYDPVIVRDQGTLNCAVDEADPVTVILDSRFDATGGLAAYGHMLLEGFGPRVILISDVHVPKVAENAARMGAQYLANGSSDLSSVRRAVTASSAALQARVSGASPLLGSSPAMKELRTVIRNVADTDAPVMILGESGTGKELVAKAIHDCSRRAAGGFVPVNMAELPENLFESVLFGHEKGAFTGADKRQLGLCVQADQGTLFLDEIGEMNRELQPKLLRFLQEHTVRRVGGAGVDKIDARIVSATNRNLNQLIERGQLREDLFFRLHVIPIEVPPLRDRREDIPHLAQSFLDRKCRRVDRTLSFSGDLLEKLCDYSWPGNIRQLENAVERMAVMATHDVIGLETLPREFHSVNFETQQQRVSNSHIVADLDQLVVVNDRQLTRMEVAERSLIIDALRRHDGNVGSAAKFLGLGQATIYRKIRSLEIPKSGTSHGSA